MFKQISTSSLLNKVKWYGTDGISLNDALLSDEIAATFAASAGLTCSIQEDNTFGAFSPASVTLDYCLDTERITMFLTNMYDVIWLVVLAYEQAGPDADYDQFWTDLEAKTENVWGISAGLLLDPNHDRAISAYAFNTVQADNGTTIWKTTARCRSAGSIGFILIPEE